jgi:6,7-dimethyl-8-ribityllumazine synthase
MSAHPTGGRPEGSDRHLLIVEARFYPDISDALLAGALAALREAGATFDRVQVPGALEIPTAIGLAADSGLYDAQIALGCVIRGETSHYDIVAGESARGLVELGVGRRVLIGNGILTCDTREQAMLRADPARKDKGGAAARAAVALLELARCLRPADG